MSWESLIKRSGMVYILFKSRDTDSGPPDYTPDEGYPVKAFSSYKILYDFLLRQKLMDLDPNNVESTGVDNEGRPKGQGTTPVFDTYKTKEFKERLAKEGLYVVTLPLDNMGDIE